MNFVLWTGCWSSLSLLGCSAGQGHGGNRHAHQKKKKNWTEPNGVENGELFYMEIPKVHLH